MIARRIFAISLIALLALCGSAIADIAIDEDFCTVHVPAIKVLININDKTPAFLPYYAGADAHRSYRSAEIGRSDALKRRLLKAFPASERGISIANSYRSLKNFCVSHLRDLRQQGIDAISFGSEDERLFCGHLEKLTTHGKKIARKESDKMYFILLYKDYCTKDGNEEIRLYGQRGASVQKGKSYLAEIKEKYDDWVREGYSSSSLGKHVYPPMRQDDSEEDIHDEERFESTPSASTSSMTDDESEQDYEGGDGDESDDEYRMSRKGYSSRSSDDE